MPKIDAPTVVEHHARRRAAVVESARQALGSGGIAAVTPGAVAKAAGLARTSVYQYFPSTESLLTAAIEDLFVQAAHEITVAVDGSADPWQRIRAYIGVALSAAAGHYGPFQAIAADDLPEGTRARLRDLHDDLAAPLTDAVAEVGVPSVPVATALIMGAIGAGITMVSRGADATETADATFTFVVGGLRAQGGRSDPASAQGGGGPA